MNETTSEHVINTRSDAQFNKGRTVAMVAGGIVYVGVVIAVTTLFVGFITTAFPSSDYASRFILGVAGFLVGCSMIAFPIALHFWAVSGVHRYVAIGFYLGEILIVAINTITSFSALRYQNAGVPLPAWIQWYETYAIVSIVYTLFAWGVIALLDPHIQRIAADRAAQEKLLDKAQAKATEFLDSIEGEEAVERLATQIIQDKFYPDLRKRRHWGNGQLDQAQPSPVLSRLAQGRPTLPARHEYTTQDLCRLWNMTPDGAASVLEPYDYASDAYEAFMRDGFLPKDMGPNNFSTIFYDLWPSKSLRPAPRVPTPYPVDVAPKDRGNGRNP